MLPVLLSIGPITIYSYGVFLFFGFLFGLFVIWKRSREEHFEEDQIFDSILATGLYALLGARIVYIFFHFNLFGLNPLSWLNLIGKPGFSVFGALIGGFLAAFLQTKKRKWNFFEFADILILGATLTYVFGWLGAFLNGSSVGIVTESFVGGAFQGVYDQRHPVQLYGVILYLVLFIYLWWVEGKYRTFEWYSGGKAGAKEGFIFFNFFLFSGFIGIILTVFTQATISLLGLSIDIWLYTTMLFVGLVGLYRRSGRELRKDLQNLGGSKERIKRIKAKERRRLRKKVSKITDILG